MEWRPGELTLLTPILDTILEAVQPLAGKSVLVLCSAAGQLAFWLADRMEHGAIMGLELSAAAIDVARSALRRSDFGDVSIEFRPAGQTSIPAEDGAFHAVVSDFIVFPTPEPTEISQREMARVLKPGGAMVVTDVIAATPMPNDHREALRAVGLEYICEARPDDFRGWMTDAGLSHIELIDFSSLVRAAWQRRRGSASLGADAAGFSLLLEDPRWRVGQGIRYIYAHGTKPAA